MHSKEIICDITMHRMDRAKKFHFNVWQLAEAVKSNQNKDEIQKKDGCTSKTEDFRNSYGG